MTFPKYIACIASYYTTDPSIETMRSIVVSRTKDDSVIVSRYYDLNDYTDDDACEEIDSIIGYYKDRGESIDVIFGDSPIKLIKYGKSFDIRMITKSDYIKIMKIKEKDQSGMYGLD